MFSSFLRFSAGGIFRRRTQASLYVVTSFRFSRRDGFPKRGSPHRPRNFRGQAALPASGTRPPANRCVRAALSLPISPSPARSLSIPLSLCLRVCCVSPFLFSSVCPGLYRPVLSCPFVLLPCHVPLPCPVLPCPALTCLVIVPSLSLSCPSPYPLPVVMSSCSRDGAADRRRHSHEAR